MPHQSTLVKLRSILKATYFRLKETRKRGRGDADVERRGAADVADAAERGRGHEDPSGCLRKTRDRAQQKVDSSVLAHVFNA